MKKILKTSTNVASTVMRVFFRRVHYSSYKLTLKLFQAKKITKAWKKEENLTEIVYQFRGTFSRKHSMVVSKM